MAKTYTTAQGDSWDAIAYRLYGDEKYMGLLIEANWREIETLVFSSGTVLTVPDIPEEADTDLPFWRQDDNVEDEYDYSDTEDPEDDDDWDDDDEDDGEDEDE